MANPRSEAFTAGFLPAAASAIAVAASRSPITTTRRLVCPMHPPCPAVHGLRRVGSPRWMTCACGGYPRGEPRQATDGRNVGHKSASNAVEENRAMRSAKRLMAVALAMALVTGGSRVAAGEVPDDVQETTQKVRKALAKLPYYGVFDFLAFSL